MTFCAHQMRRRRRDVAHSLFVMHHTPNEDFIPVISLELPPSRTMKYYDLKKNWRKVRRHLVDEELNEVLVRDFNKFTYGRWRKEFTPGCFPSEFETSDWSLNHRGRRPAFWKYTASYACHWLVNFQFALCDACRAGTRMANCYFIQTFNHLGWCKHHFRVQFPSVRHSRDRVL